MPKLTKAQTEELQRVRQKAADKFAAATAALEGDEPDNELYDSLWTEGEQLETQADKLEKVYQKSAKFRQPVHETPLPTDDDDDTTVITPPDTSPPDPEQERMKAFNILRYSKVDLVNMPVDELAEFKAIKELYGADYRQVNHDQDMAFQRYLRGKGVSSALTHDDDRILRKLYYPLKHVAEMISVGNPVDRVKTTMVEGIDELGGYAVPPERANAILARAMGLTAVRTAGAMVVQTASKRIDWLKLTGGDDQYTSALRGAYGTETVSGANLTEGNLTWGTLPIDVHIYTYKAPFSVSLLEDAENMVQIFEMKVAEVLAIEEDRDFLIGDGANKPYGILPGASNGLSLTEVVTGDADDLTMGGLKSLRRGIGSQYRLAGGTAFIGNNASGEDIELLVDGNGRYFFESINHGDAFMGGRWFESETLSDPSAGVYPIIFGNFSGYIIAERLGLSIDRFRDSNTGPNVVEYHIRRRIGGRLAEPWKFAVQKVSAS